MRTEADEGATTKARALYNLAAQTAKGETMGVVQMYENAAVMRGASFDETERFATIGRLARDYAGNVALRKAAGDYAAEYHAQRPKVRAYKLLMVDGLNARQVVDYFAKLLKEIE